MILYRFVPPPVTATMVMDPNGITKDWEPLSRIDRNMVAAVIAAEDGKFCTHDGFDREAIEKAMERNARGGRIRGGSTISQQTAKNVFLWQGGGYLRKGLEAWFTLPDRERLGQAADHGSLSQRRRDRHRHLRRRGRGAALFRPFRRAAFRAARRRAWPPPCRCPRSAAVVNPGGFTRRYGNTIAARIGVVRRDGLDACVYD